MRTHASLFWKENGSSLYNNITKNEPIKNAIENKYEKVYTILDKNFHVEFPEKTKARLLELEVAYGIFKGGYMPNVLDKRKDEEGPDFILNIPEIKSRLCIECVCATLGKNQLKNIDREMKEYREDNDYVKIGYDKGYESRFTSIIKDKAEKIRDYRKNRIITDDDIVVLVVSSDFYGIKGEEYLGDHFEFEIAISQTKLVTYEVSYPNQFEVKREDADPLNILKNNKRILGKGEDWENYKKDLNEFNVFIHCRDYIGLGSTNRFKIFHDKPLDEALNNILEKIFVSNGMFSRIID
ncbi:MAG: hypothetical protein LBM19_01735 [Holosporales bacterium]|nr:hypothetical protein [Holosporales bacterium]